MNAPLRLPLSPEPQPARFSADEFSAMIGAGIFRDWIGKTELDHGTIVRMNAKYVPHAYLQRQLDRAFQARLNDLQSGLEVWTEISVELADNVVREPDIAITASLGGVLKLVPADRLRLAVAVAASTLAADLAKAADYSAARVPEYWVADMKRKVVHLHADPRPSGYATRREAPFGTAFDSAILGRFTVEG